MGTVRIRKCTANCSSLQKVLTVLNVSSRDLARVSKVDSNEFALWGRREGGEGRGDEVRGGKKGCNIHPQETSHCHSQNVKSCRS